VQRKKISVTAVEKISGSLKVLGVRHLQVLCSEIMRGKVMGGIYQYLDEKFRERIMELEKSGDIKDLQRKKDTAENGIHINKGPGRKH